MPELTKTQKEKIAELIKEDQTKGRLEETDCAIYWELTSRAIIKMNCIDR